MLLSLSLILLIGFTLSGLFIAFKLPGLLGMMLTGVLLGPHVLNLISPQILTISADLREIALVVILMRAGLSIDFKDLKQIGFPAIRMSFIPASFEIIAITFLAPLFLSITYLEAVLMGTILAAVSPAIIVPRMLHLIEDGYGKEKRIPQLIMAGASVDDIYVIVLFTSLLTFHTGGDLNLSTLLTVPVSILLGLALGILSGYALVFIFKKLHIRDTIKVMMLLSISFLFVTLEAFMRGSLPLSGLLAVMALGGTLLEIYPLLAKRLMGKFSKIWVGAELLLFVLVGATVDIQFIPKAGSGAVFLILSALVFRVIGVLISLMGTSLNAKEKLYCSIAYLPKATVQAAIGAIPLSAGLAAGDTLLAVAVLAIMITAPLGAISMDYSYKHLLERSHHQ